MGTKEWTPLPNWLKLEYINKQRAEKGLPPWEKYYTPAERRERGLPLHQSAETEALDTENDYEIKAEDAKFLENLWKSMLVLHRNDDWEVVDDVPTPKTTKEHEDLKDPKALLTEEPRVPLGLACASKEYHAKTEQASTTIDESRIKTTTRTPLRIEAGFAGGEQTAFWHSLAAKKIPRVPISGPGGKPREICPANPPRFATEPRMFLAKRGSECV